MSAGKRSIGGAVVLACMGLLVGGVSVVFGLEAIAAQRLSGEGEQAIGQVLACDQHYNRNERRMVRTVSGVAYVVGGQRYEQRARVFWPEHADCAEGQNVVVLVHRRDPALARPIEVIEGRGTFTFGSLAGIVLALVLLAGAAWAAVDKAPR